MLDELVLALRGAHLTPPQVQGGRQILGMVRVGGEEPFRRFFDGGTITVKSTGENAREMLPISRPLRHHVSVVHCSHSLEGLGWPGRDLKGMLKAPPAKRVHLLPPRERDTIK